MRDAFRRFVSFGAPVAVGAAVLFAVVQSRAPAERAEITERARAVRVLTVEPTAFVPSVTGYGTVSPPREWDAVAQVAGRVDYVHPELRPGELLPSGVEVIRISPVDYELAVREAVANLESAKTQLSELEVQTDNSEKSLEIERRSLELIRDDVERKRNLVARSAVSKATLDEAERSFLSQEAKVLELENSLRLNTVQIAAQKTQIDVNEARLATARLDLERTRIALPFEARVSELDVEETQFVAVGATLAAAYDIRTAEVAAQIPLRQFATFVRLATPEGLKVETALTPTNGSIIRQFGWHSIVRSTGGEPRATWEAEIVRMSETIDATTRTLGAVVSVPDPYRDLRPGVRPPLVKGMFVEVELEGPTLSGQIVVPRSAVTEGRVLVADDENRLRRRDVEVRAIQGDEALITGGLSAGERIVLSDLSPAIEGMLLEPVEMSGDDAAIDQSAEQ